jgi:hypothetical protein
VSKKVVIHWTKIVLCVITFFLFLSIKCKKIQSHIDIRKINQYNEIDKEVLIMYGLFSLEVL